MKWCRGQTPQAIQYLLEQLDESAARDARWQRVIWCLGQDPRSSVRELAENAQEVLRDLPSVPSLLYRYENTLWSLGYTVCGVDEVGRGSLAGPVIASAVVFPRFTPLEGVADSKTLNPRRRTVLCQEIRQRALAVAVGCAQPDEVDGINVYRASQKAMFRAIHQLAVVPDHLLIDAMPLEEVGIPAWSIVRGDALSGSIAAASIVAKVTRDEIMDQLDETFPQYGFCRHKGYATREHLESLERWGPCPVHRFSYEPVRRAQEAGGPSSSMLVKS